MYNYRVWSARKMCTGCRAVGGARVGLVRSCGCGPGESELRRGFVICRILCSQIINLNFCGEECKYLTFRSCQSGVGRGSRVGGRDWAWWSGKAKELMDFDVAMQRCLVFCIRPFSSGLWLPS